MSAGAASGLVRTTFNLAEYLARSYDVEIVSVVRRRRTPFFPLPQGVRLTTVDNQLGPERSRAGVKVAVRTLLHRSTGNLIHPADPRARETTFWTDLMLVRALRRLDADVVVGSRYSLSLIASRLARPGLVVIGHEHMSLSAKGPLKLDAIRATALDALVVLTETDRQRYEAVLGGNTRVVCIPNAVPAAGARLSDVSRPVILGAGHLTRRKGFDRLIAAFAVVARQHPDWTLRICGVGPAMDSLQRLTVKHGVEDRTQLPGAVKDMATEMEHASIFALSSRFEGFPMVLLEAMSTGLPVVAFDCPTGPADIVAQGRTGILVRDGDIESFTAALLELVVDKEKRRRFGAAATERTEMFSLERVGALWKQLLTDLGVPAAH